MGKSKKHLPSDLEYKTRTSTLTNIVLKVLTRTISRKKEIIGVKIRTEEVKLSMFAEDVIFCTKKAQKTPPKICQSQCINSVQLQIAK